MHVRYTEYFSSSSILSMFYFFMMELIWIAYFLLSIPPGHLQRVVIGSSLLVFVVLIAMYWLRISKARNAKILIFTATGWFIVHNYKSKPLPDKKWLKIELLPSSMIFPHFTLLKFKWPDGTKGHWVFWLDTLGESKYRELSRSIKQSLNTMR